jgi:hypothetical protein
MGLPPVPHPLARAALAAAALLCLAAKPPTWRPIAPGAEYGTLRVAIAPTHGDGLLHVVRVDPAWARLTLRAASAGPGNNLTAAQWAQAGSYAAVINAGMYEQDFTTHTGHLRIGGHINSAPWVGAYKSLFTLGTPAQTRITDTATRPAGLEAFTAAVQNLRLIAGPGRNVWAENGRQWSEAALAMDSAGRLLFVFSRTPFSMRAFNRLLLNSGLGVTHAQHLEGGPEASLSVHGGGIDLDLCGSYETGFVEHDDNAAQWPLPNVLAVEAGP